MSSIDRMPPHNDLAEKDVIGCILLGGEETFNEVRQIIDSNDFYNPEIQTIFVAMMRLVKEQKPITVLNISGVLPSMDIPWLSDMQNRAMSEKYAESHALIIKDCSIRRSIMRCCNELENEALITEDPMSAVSKGLVYYTNLMSSQKTDTMISLSNIIGPVFETFEKRDGKNGIIGAPTGFNDLNRLIGGWQPGYYILAGRPSMGKTTLALQFAQKLGHDQNFPVGIFSLEMSKEQLTEKFFSMVGRVNSYALRNPSPVWSQLSRAYSQLGNTQIYIDDKSHSLTKLEISMRKFKAEHPNGIVIIDYLQLIDPEKYSSVREETTRISRKIMNLKLELQMPIIVLSQLSRDVENRENKRPVLSDLRESGSLEQDADVVMFTYRDDYYQGVQQDPSPLELIVKKNRMGICATVNLAFFKGESRFAELELKHDVPQHGPKKEMY